MKHKVSELEGALLDAAVALSDIDPRVDSRPVVDVEELIIYWMELWGASD